VDSAGNPVAVATIHARPVSTGSTYVSTLPCVDGGKRYGCPAGETVTPELLRAHGFVRRASDPIKVLGDGELTTKLAIHAQAFSASAKEKITKAGGTFEVVA